MSLAKKRTDFINEICESELYPLSDQWFQFLSLMSIELKQDVGAEFIRRLFQFIESGTAMDGWSEAFCASPRYFLGQFNNGFAIRLIGGKELLTMPDSEKIFYECVERAKKKYGDSKDDDFDIALIFASRKIEQLLGQLGR